MSSSVCRTGASVLNTPPRLSADNSDSATSFNTPMFTPSPLRAPHVFQQATQHSDLDDFFFRSPLKSPTPIHSRFARRHTDPESTPMGDEDGEIFFSSPFAGVPPVFSTPSSPPLHTPIKQEHRTGPRSILGQKHLNAAAHTPGVPSARSGLGTKRKSFNRSAGSSTPVPKPAPTPLSISVANADPASGVAFHRLAPLPAPRFVTQTPPSRAETEAYMKTQAETMTRLRIRDARNSDEEWGFIDDDSGCEVEEETVDKGRKLFLNKLPSLSSIRKPKSKNFSPRKPFVINTIPQKGSLQDEVTEAVSPEGHILKRRARSRPVSLDLLGSASSTPSPPRNQTQTALPRSGVIGFPHAEGSRPNSIVLSSPEPDSPSVPRDCISGVRLSPFLPSTQPAEHHRRAPLDRLASASSATLFFGPAIPSPNKPRSRTATMSSSIPSSQTPIPPGSSWPDMPARHSYSQDFVSPDSWKLRNPQPDSPNSSSSSNSPEDSMAAEDDDEMFFNGPLNSSLFDPSVAAPSPRSKSGRHLLPTKFKPRDSGVVLSEDEGRSNPARLFTTSSINTLQSDADELVPPGVGPSTAFGWPAAVRMTGLDDGSSVASGDQVDTDALILFALASDGKSPDDSLRKPPGTPVKKAKAAFGRNKPWQSAVASKVGLNFDLGNTCGKIRGKPRKSLPAAFPVLSARKDRKVDLSESDTDEDEENQSPSSRKDGRYEGIGMGMPPVSGGRSRFLLRRSSSGAFSSGSDVSVQTPTRRFDGHSLFVSAKPSFLSHDRTASRSSSISSIITLNSPTMARRQVDMSPVRRPQISPLVPPSRPTSSCDKGGRFERDFVEIEEVGSGEFGKVMKVRGKTGLAANQVWAVKRSKVFEGSRHRLRLREEVDVLQHLSESAAAAGYRMERHPNVLAYLDSWEQENTLFIRTELCELGNFARFLWKYGRACPKLDEAHVWRIFADLSDGLRFIHNAGVIHLDLKPANIFITREGRLKIGDFGMATIWPRASNQPGGGDREGDKLYMARELLHGAYSPAADIFSLGMTMLEAATNILVPDQGDGWQRLRSDDFSQIDLSDSPELLDLIQSMMREDPMLRFDANQVYSHPIVQRARVVMKRMEDDARRNSLPLFNASPLGKVPSGFLDEILSRPAEDNATDMDVDF